MSTPPTTSLHENSSTCHETVPLSRCVVVPGAAFYAAKVRPEPLLHRVHGAHSCDHTTEERVVEGGGGGVDRALRADVRYHGGNSTSRRLSTWLMRRCTWNATRCALVGSLLISFAVVVSLSPGSVCMYVCIRHVSALHVQLRGYLGLDKTARHPR
jgi:hypothetical protein